MSLDLQIAELVQRYLNETKNQELTITEIMSRPRWKRVWFWWKAMEYYDGKSLPMSQDDCKNIYGE